MVTKLPFSYCSIGFLKVVLQMVTLLTKGGGIQMLTLADKGGWGVIQMLTFADRGGGGGSKMA